MFINFWYPALAADELTDGPVGVRMLGLPFVLARDADGRAFCLSNVCCHRGGALSGGRLKDGCIECPYHGWQFNAAGRCTRIPSLGPEAKIPGRCKVDSYPVEERYGLVFVFLGDLPEAERPPILPIPEYGQNGWRANLLVFDARCHYQRSVENGLDPSHAEFVHSFGRKGENPDYFLPDYEVTESEWGCGFSMGFGVLDRQGNKASSEAGTTHNGVSQFLTYIHFQGRRSNQYMYELPVDEQLTRIFLVNLRNFHLDPAQDDEEMAANMRVVREDLAVIEDLAPVRSPSMHPREFLVPADKVTARYREYLADWERRGWRMDTDALARRASRQAFAIPSPARRDAGGWVLDPVPLVPGERGEAGAARRAGT